MRYSIEAGEEKGRPHPQWYLDEPIISPREALYLHAFYDLSTCRAIGFGALGPIPWLMIVIYADRMKLSFDVHRAFVQIIRHMDSEGYLPDAAKQAESKRKKGKKH